MEDVLQPLPLEESIANVSRIDRGNKEIEALCKSLLTAVKEKLPDYSLDSFTITPERYKTLTENLGLELVKPRNYLSYEVVTCSYQQKKIRLYIGEYENMTFFKSAIYSGCIDLITKN